MVYENRPLASEEYEAVKGQETFEYQKFKSYNPDFWAGYNIIEPNAAIKEFTAMEAE
ncbi:hypothetical protein [Salinimicrobium catena]|uniref:hypothetical protein n=1 Tax=Salinimicrobium catena TaxID=390640 RepID=UPI0015A0EFD2|nr:hypothetical protein [Salinimicrobium catena]